MNQWALEVRGDECPKERDKMPHMLSTNPGPAQLSGGRSATGLVTMQRQTGELMGGAERWSEVLHWVRRPRQTLVEYFRYLTLKRRETGW